MAAEAICPASKFNCFPHVNMLYNKIVFKLYCALLWRFLMLVQSGLLTVPEAAEYLRIKLSTMRAWRLQRRIEFVKLGGRLVVRRSVLDALIEKCVVPAVPKPEVRQ